MPPIISTYAADNLAERIKPDSMSGLGNFQEIQRIEKHEELHQECAISKTLETLRVRKPGFIK